MVTEFSKRGKHVKNIRIFLPKEIRNKFMFNVPKGLLVSLYAPQPVDNNTLVEQDRVNIKIVANENEPNPLERRYMEDIDTYLASLQNIDPRIRIISEKVTEKEQPNIKQDWYIKNEVLADHPGLDSIKGARKNLGNLHDVEVTESQIRHMEETYAKLKKDFVRTKLEEKTLTEKRDPITNEKIYLVKQGEM